MTVKEKAIFKALNSSISVQFKDSRLEDVIEYLETVTGLTIALDKNALDSLNINYDTPVSANVKRVTLRFLLHKILGDLGLTYVVKDELIEVVTPQQARDMMVVRTYNIADLVVDPYLPGLEFVNAAVLIDLIETTIDPQSWRRNGGNGTIVYLPATRSLVIKQSAEFHGVFSGGLK
jgi:hypothetical protein